MCKKIVVTLLTAVLLIGSLFASGTESEAKLHLEVNVREFFIHGFFDGVFDTVVSGEGDYLLSFADADFWHGLDEAEDFTFSRSVDVSLDDGLDDYLNVATYHIATNTPSYFSIGFDISDFESTDGFSIPWSLIINSSSVLTNLTLNGGSPPLSLSSDNTYLGVLTQTAPGPSVGYLYFDITFTDDSPMVSAGSYEATVTATVTAN
jgi:hypothetical protein